jgi:outer membrane protein OmpA-like peptidoglycan-associated protein
MGPYRVNIGATIAAAMCFALMGGAAAKADPAYTANTLLDSFLKDKAAAEHKGKTRAVCFAGDDDPDCAPQKSSTHDLLLNFDFDSDRLTASAKENLAQVAAALRDPRLHGTRFEIDGYTDATGADEYNLTLSQRRAQSVVNYLIGSGVPRTSLSAKGYGKAKPRVNDPFSPENRRVETHLVTE